VGPAFQRKHGSSGTGSLNWGGGEWVGRKKGADLIVYTASEIRKIGQRKGSRLEREVMPKAQSLGSLLVYEGPKGSRKEVFKKGGGLKSLRWQDHQVFQ